MKFENPIVRATLSRAALLTVIATAHAAEQVVDAGAANINVGTGDSVWFDSTNTNAAILLGTINDLPPPPASCPAGPTPAGAS
ncbi:hypothetical protein [Luteolibacter sp. Populi]|uniref:hypothetical protein n=1 Tax=Luteolibacter sp. Populi TaxID=3230487 RepID=UPI003467086B